MSSSRSRPEAASNSSSAISVASSRNCGGMSVLIAGLPHLLARVEARDLRQFPVECLFALVGGGRSDDGQHAIQVAASPSWFRQALPRDAKLLSSTGAGFHRHGDAA